jgi:hypothetical protein
MLRLNYEQVWIIALHQAPSESLWNSFANYDKKTQVELNTKFSYNWHLKKHGIYIQQ